MAYAENQITLEVVEDGNEVYVTEPTTPYSAGDLYVDKDETTTAMVTDDDDPLVDDSDNQFEVVEVGESDIYVCTNPRGSGEFNNDDWRLAASTQDKKLREHFWHDDNGAHVLGDETGFRNDITSTGMKIVDTSSETSVAEFGTETTIKTTDGTELVHFGYALGTAQSGTAIAPYYTLGVRSGVVGNYSTVEGDNCEASGYASHAEGAGCSATKDMAHAEGANTTASARYTHAEGLNCTASKDYAHAEGYNCTASDYAAHAEGSHTTASGQMSHAEGTDTVASAHYSHAQNLYTIAASSSQTSLGKYNIEDANGTYAVIIGNGTADNSRSNALTVDWSGNVVLAGGLTVASPTTSFSGTVGTGLTGSCNGIYDALSKTVRINFQVRKSTDIATSDVLFTIPSAYRPSAAVTGSGVVEAYVSSAYRTRAYEVTLNTSGEITQGYSNYARSIFGVFEYSL